MKTNRYLLGLALLVVGTMPVFSQVSNENDDEVYKIDARAGRNDFVPGQILVKFKDESPVNVRRAAGRFKSVDEPSVNNVLQEFGVETMEKLFPNAKPLQTRRRAKAFNGQMIEEKDLSQIYLVKTKSLRKDSTMQLVDKLKTLDEVEYAEPNYKVYIMGQLAPMPMTQSVHSVQQATRRAYSTETTDDKICVDPSKNPLYGQQWGLEYEGLPELWEKPIKNKKRPVIAILDTGVDITHPDLVDNIWTKPGTNDVHGYDFINNTTEIRDYNSHGTHVAGIAAASNNEVGIIGANPQALIMPITVMQSDGTGDAATIAQGVDYAVENGATILNMSFGSYANSQTLRQALANAYQSAVLVAAAGNDGLGIYDPCMIGSLPMFPAAFEFVLGTQAISKGGALASFSNFDCDGPTFSLPGYDTFSSDDGAVNYEMACPGVGIISTIPEGNYKQLNGTSMAAPLLAGAISVLQMVKKYNTQEVLWGDIIHSATIAKAYDVTERPAILELVTLQWDDSQDGGNGDGQPDAGETLRLYPKIKTVWGEAKNIKLNLSVGEYEDASLVEIQSKDVEFGWTLSNYAKEISKNPIIIKIANNVADSRHIRLVLTATCDGSQHNLNYEFNIVVNNIVKIGGIIGSDMTLTADKNYLVTSNLGIPEGVVLTIEPGTTIEFGPNTGISSMGKVIANGTPSKMIQFVGHKGSRWKKLSIKDRLSYCIISNSTEVFGNTEGSNSFDNCIFKNCSGFSSVEHDYSWTSIRYTDVNITNSNIYDNIHALFRSQGVGWKERDFNNNNIINNVLFGDALGESEWLCVRHSNYFNNTNTSSSVLNNYENWESAEILYNSETPNYLYSSDPSYLGTSIEKNARKNILDANSNYGFGIVDLSNMPIEPFKEAHGIVWKVVVNGKDAQDEYDELDPLGVGKHKFEVYFNRPMNKEKIPQISFGVREPYTQNAVAEDGAWNAEGTIYTAYVTITGKTQSDGVNRVYVYGAEDDEYFECPYEKTRFNVNVQSAGSQSTGFMGEAGLGRVELNWNTPNTDMADVLGYNVYRYTTSSDNSVRVNDIVIDASEAQFTDNDITPGTTYYYQYKVQSTDLKEYQPSNVVAVTPKTAKLGDVTGNNEVDVFDVVYEVNYILGQKPKAFVKCAADVNEDKLIDILDVQGIIIKILNPSSASARIMVESTATYSIEDGILYVESPVALGGLQVQVNVPEKTDITTLDDLKGFEQAGAWLSDNDYLFLAYNMNGKTLSAGKHALLRIGNGQVTNIRLGDADGKNVEAIAGAGTTSIDNMSTNVWLQQGIYNLKGQKISGNANELNKLPKGVYIINGTKILK